MADNRKKRQYKDVISEKASPVDPKAKKPVKRNWQQHAKDQVKK